MCASSQQWEFEQQIWSPSHPDVPQQVNPGGKHFSLHRTQNRGHLGSPWPSAPRARVALPRPREASNAPPTAPLTILSASLLETGLAMTREMSSISALIVFPPPALLTPHERAPVPRLSRARPQLISDYAPCQPAVAHSSETTCLRLRSVRGAVTRPGSAPLCVAPNEKRRRDSCSSQTRHESEKSATDQEKAILRLSSSYPGTTLVERINHLASSIDATINYLFEILLFAAVRV